MLPPPQLSSLPVFPPRNKVFHVSHFNQIKSLIITAMNKRPLAPSNIENQRFSLPKSNFQDPFKRCKSSLHDLLHLIRNRLPQELLLKVREEMGDQSLISDPMMIILWLKNVFNDLLKTINQSERSQEQQEQNNYQSLLQKLQSDIRQHIRIEQEMKIYSDTMQAKAEESMKKIELLQKENRSLKQPKDKRHNLSKDQRDRESLTKLRKPQKTASAKIKQRSLDVRKSSSKQQINDRLKKMKQSVSSGIGTFRPSLSKLSRKL